MSIEISTLPGALARVGGKLEAMALASVAARLIVAEVETDIWGTNVGGYPLFCGPNRHYTGDEIAGRGSQIACQL